MSLREIGILGLGGQAKETESYLPLDIKVLFYAVSKEYLPITHTSNQIDIESKEYTKVPIVAAIGAPLTKKKMIGLWGGRKYYSVVSKDTNITQNCKIGQGTIIGPGTTITNNVKIGDHTLININTSISHDTKIGNFVTISPGVDLGGNVTIGDGVFIGIGATIINGVKIADGVVIGAGAVVLKDISEKNSVVAGVPAKKIKLNSSWLGEI